jgi:hypothetical protein
MVEFTDTPSDIIPVILLILHQTPDPTLRGDTPTYKQIYKYPSNVKLQVNYDIIIRKNIGFP